MGTPTLTNKTKTLLTFLIYMVVKDQEFVKTMKLFKHYDQDLGRLIDEILLTDFCHEEYVMILQKYFRLEFPIINHYINYGPDRYFINKKDFHHDFLPENWFDETRVIKENIFNGYPPFTDAEWLMLLEHLVTFGRLTHGFVYWFKKGFSFQNKNIEFPQASNFIHAAQEIVAYRFLKVLERVRVLLPNDKWSHDTLSHKLAFMLPQDYLFIIPALIKFKTQMDAIPRLTPTFEEELIALDFSKIPLKYIKRYIPAPERKYAMRTSMFLKHRDKWKTEQVVLSEVYPAMRKEIDLLFIGINKLAVQHRFMAFKFLFKFKFLYQVIHHGYEPIYDHRQWQKDFFHVHFSKGNPTIKK